jgi:hypothetical protein
MAGANYMNLFVDARILLPYDQETYGRCLDAVLAQEGIGVDDVVGIGECEPGLVVVHHAAILTVRERGIFTKRIELERLCPIASIARIEGAQEGFKGLELTLTAHDASGATLFRLEWSLAGQYGIGETMTVQKRDHVFKLIGQAMDRHAASARF